MEMNWYLRTQTSQLIVTPTQIRMDGHGKPSLEAILQVLQ